MCFVIFIYDDVSKECLILSFKGLYGFFKSGNEYYYIYLFYVRIANLKKDKQNKPKLTIGETKVLKYFKSQNQS